MYFDLPWWHVSRHSANKAVAYFERRWSCHVPVSFARYSCMLLHDEAPPRHVLNALLSCRSTQAQNSRITPPSQNFMLATEDGLGYLGGAILSRHVHEIGLSSSLKSLLTRLPEMNERPRTGFRNPASPSVCLIILPSTPHDIDHLCACIVHKKPSTCHTICSLRHHRLGQTARHSPPWGLDMLSQIIDASHSYGPHRPRC